MYIEPKPQVIFPTATMQQSLNGWVTTERFLEWFKKFIELKTARFGTEEMVILFIDEMAILLIPIMKYTSWLRKTI